MNNLVIAKPRTYFSFLNQFLLLMLISLKQWSQNTQKVEKLIDEQMPRIFLAEIEKRCIFQKTVFLFRHTPFSYHLVFFKLIIRYY